MTALLLVHMQEARADDKAEARRHFDAGISLLKAENYEGAALSFEASLKLHPTMSGLFNLANCYKALERYDEALAALFRLRRDFKDRLSDEMRVESEAIEKEIRNLVGMLRVEVDRPGAAVLVGGREVGVSPLSRMVLLAPGDHEVTARMPGVEFGVERVRMLPGREVTVNLKGTDTGAAEGGSTPSTGSTLSTDSPTDSPPSGLSPGWFWGGLAATAVLGGVTIGIDAAVGKASDGMKTEDDLKRAERMQSAGIAFVVLTGAAAITTAVLAFFTDWGGGESDEHTVVPSAWATDSGAGLGITGRF